VSQATFLNRQALYLRPDPARVIVRPFKPATEPRDLNPLVDALDRAIGGEEVNSPRG
jgi:hypothetical protein